MLRYSERGDCAWGERLIDLPDDGPVDVCVNPITAIARYTGRPDGCAWYERRDVIGRVT